MIATYEDAFPRNSLIYPLRDAQTQFHFRQSEKMFRVNRGDGYLFPHQIPLKRGFSFLRVYSSPWRLVTMAHSQNASHISMFTEATVLLLYPSPFQLSLIRIFIS